jgi:hypothetical protein
VKRSPAFAIVFAAFSMFHAAAQDPSIRILGEKGAVNWREPIVYDVISRGGQFLGSVKFADSFSLAHSTGDYVWGTERGELDVQYVVRYRIAR